MFLIKIGFGFFIYWLYTYYYPIRSDADIYKYFDDGRVLFELAKQDFSAYLNALVNSELPEYIRPAFHNWSRPGSYNVVNTNLTMIKIHSMLFFISGGIYHIHSIIFCFASLTGILYLYKTLLNRFNFISPNLLILCFIIPSFLLWNSAPLKETLITFNLFILIAFTIKCEANFKIKYVLGIVLFSVLTFYSKPYFLIGALPLLFIYLSPRPKRTTIKYLGFISLAFIAISLFELISDNDGVTTLIYNKQLSFADLINVKNANSSITPLLNETYLGLILNTPKSLFNVLFRPFAWESLNPLFLFSAIENMIIILSIILTFVYRKKSIDYTIKNFAWFASLFILIEYTLIGLTTPVIGAIVRYKSPLLPLIFITCLLLIDLEKIKSHVSKIRS